MVVNTDNRGSMAFARDPVFHDESKQIDIQCYFTRDLTEEERLSINYVPTQEMVADLLTKSLPHPPHEQPAKRVGLC